MASFGLSSISSIEMYVVQNKIKEADADGDGKLSSDELGNLNIDSKYASVLSEGMDISSAQDAAKKAFYGVSEQQQTKQAQTTQLATKTEAQGNKLDLVA